MFWQDTVFWHGQSNCGWCWSWSCAHPPPPPLPGLLIKDKAWRGSSPSMEADMSYIYECIVGVFPVDRMYKGIQTLVIQSKYANVSQTGCCEEITHVVGDSCVHRQKCMDVSSAEPVFNRCWFNHHVDTHSKKENHRSVPVKGERGGSEKVKWGDVTLQKKQLYIILV